MTILTTFYLSRLLGCDIYDARENILGKIMDVFVQLPLTAPGNNENPFPIRKTIKYIHLNYY